MEANFMKLKMVSFVAVSFAAVVSIGLLSPLAMAGGSHCDSLKGHGPHDMSPEAWQQFKDNHAWMFSKDAKAADKAVDPKDNSTKEQPAKPSPDSMAI
jgi:hypothetical protein